MMDNEKQIVIVAYKDLNPMQKGLFKVVMNMMAILMRIKAK